MTHPVPPTPGIPPEAVARFTTAESRLYPVAMVDPAAYERAVTLTGTLLDDLRTTCRDIDAVLRRRETLMLTLADDPDADRLGLVGLTRETLVDAAAALRCRELRAELDAAAAEARVAAARKAGQEWLVDEPDPAAVMAGFYRRIERHVPTGAVLISSVEAGRPGAPATHTVQFIPSPDARPAGALTRTYQDQASWTQAAQRYRAEVSSPPLTDE
jgi:hypothetical protein